jgi:hypothetical protein
MSILDSVYRGAARHRVEFDDDVQVEADAKVSAADDGAWVQAWLWVSDDEATQYWSKKAANLP